MKTKVISKIRKLRALALQAGTAEEASAAIAKAWKLKQDNNITEADILEDGGWYGKREPRGKPIVREYKVVENPPRRVKAKGTFDPRQDNLDRAGLDQLIDQFGEEMGRRLAKELGKIFGLGI